jgi:hypothetical protein
MSTVDGHGAAVGAPTVATGREGPLEPLRAQWAWWRSRHRRALMHTRPLFTPAPGGRHRLPGTEVDTVLHEAPDPYRRHFGMILVPATGHVSVALDVRPGPPAGTGHEGVDESWVGDLGGWLAGLAHEPGLTGCSVILQRAPTRSRHHRVRVLVQPTWLTTGLHGRSDPASLAIEIGSRLPGLVRSVDRCGVGTARPLAARELAAVVHAGYHPGSGAPSPGDAGRRPWTEAAPVDHTERWQHLRHGAATSLTWTMSRIPSGVGLSSVLTQLVGTPPEGTLTRVALLHTPDGTVTPATSSAGGPAGGSTRRSTRGSTGDRTDDWTGLGSAPRPRLGNRSRPATKAVGDLPRSAALVTITSPHGPDELGEAAAAVLDGLPTALRPWLRPLYGSQAAAFAAGLPSGTLLAAHAAPPCLLTGPE